MARIAITGHMNITPEAVPIVREAIRKALAEYESSDVVGVSCIARGADVIFAEEVIRFGGRLEVVLPSDNYRDSKVKPSDALMFDRLIDLASQVRIMPFKQADRIAYEAANNVLISECDELFAVWDGEMGIDKGGTAAVVSEARSRGTTVRVIWPEGARREET